MSFTKPKTCNPSPLVCRACSFLGPLVKPTNNGAKISLAQAHFKAQTISMAQARLKCRQARVLRVFTVHFTTFRKVLNKNKKNKNSKIRKKFWLGRRTTFASAELFNKSTCVFTIPFASFVARSVIYGSLSLTLDTRPSVRFPFPSVCVSSLRSFRVSLSLSLILSRVLLCSWVFSQKYSQFPESYPPFPTQKWPNEWILSVICFRQVLQRTQSLKVWLK